MEGGFEFLLAGVGGVRVVRRLALEAGSEAGDFGDLGEGAGDGGQSSLIQVAGAQAMLKGVKEVVGNFPFALPDGRRAIGPGNNFIRLEIGFELSALLEEAGLVAIDATGPIEFAGPR